MPKILENVREQLLREARKQVTEGGYSGMTIRSVAIKCGLGVGTVYNYFPSKEMLVATFVYEEWLTHLDEMKRLPSYDPRALLCGIYTSLVSFAKKNEKLFSDKEAARQISSGFPMRHKMLRDQIAEFILPLCEARVEHNAAFTADFISESLVCWSMAGIDIETVYPILEKIIN